MLHYPALRTTFREVYSKYAAPFRSLYASEPGIDALACLD
jgi:hypothetical protein